MKNKPTWSGVGIHTVSSLQRSRRRLDRQRLAVERAAAAMRAGAILCLEHGRDRRWWVLSPSGSIVTEDVAAILTARPDIRATGDTLFPDMKSQTWQFIEPREDSR
jgi:hypothetical protein